MKPPLSSSSRAPVIDVIIAAFLLPERSLNLKRFVASETGLPHRDASFLAHFGSESEVNDPSDGRTK